MLKKMMSILFVSSIVLACGGAEETENQEPKNDSETDTTSTDSVAVEDESELETFYFEDYAQFNTKSALYAAYDAANLKDESAWYAEGTVEVKTTKLTDPETGNVIQFSWDEDGETLDFIETWNNTWMADSPKEQRVETKEGLYTGMPLDELLEWNEGVDFEFSGFGWDYAGNVFTEGSRLNESPITVTLTMLDEGYDNYGSLIGDGTHSTADEDVKGAPIVIGTIAYNL